MGDSANYGRLRGPERVTSAKVDIWSTDDTRARERFSYWRDAGARAVLIAVDVNQCVNGANL